MRFCEILAATIWPLAARACRFAAGTSSPVPSPERRPRRSHPQGPCIRIGEPSPYRTIRNAAHAIVAPEIHAEPPCTDRHFSSLPAARARIRPRRGLVSPLPPTQCPQSLRRPIAAKEEARDVIGLTGPLPKHHRNSRPQDTDESSRALHDPLVVQKLCGRDGRRDGRATRL